MVTIIKENCTGCGSCVDICHESCMFLLDGKIQIDYNFCSTCTQCIAICPHYALRWENRVAEKYNNELLPSSQQMDELLKQRRTIRYFKKEKPGHHLLREIINYGAYAPTHNHNFRIIAVDDQKQLDKIDQAVYSSNKKIYKYFYRPRFMPQFMKMFSPSQQKEYLRAKPKLEKSLEIHKGYYCLPPVILFIVGEKKIPLSLESAQYILYNIDLYAKLKGLGCRNLVGNQMFFNRSKKIRGMLKLRRDEKVFATLGIGYPAKKFRNKVQGRTLEIYWSS